MQESSVQFSPFRVKDCTLATIATGLKAQSLLDFKAKLQIIPPSSIYFHFWGGRLRTTFEHREYHNDFSDWAHRCLHDDILAERIELLDPTDYLQIENIAADLIEIIEERFEESTFFSLPKVEPFYFMKSKIIVFDTQYQIQHPKELKTIFPILPRSSIFYHFIDSKRRLKEHTDDFSQWLGDCGEEYQGLANAFKKIDPYFISLGDLQKKIIQIVDNFL